MSTVSASTGVARPTLGLSARSKPRRTTRAIHSRRATFASATSSSVSIVEDRARATITYCFGEETRTTAAEIVFSVDGFDVYGPALAEPEAPANLAPEPVDPTLGVVDDSGAVTYSFDDGDDVDPEIRPAGDVDNDPTEATRDLSAGRRLHPRRRRSRSRRPRGRDGRALRAVGPLHSIRRRVLRGGPRHLQTAWPQRG